MRIVKNMAVAQERCVKTISKLLRTKAHEFLSSRKHANNLVDIIRYFESGLSTPACLLTIEMIFIELLKRRDMYEEIVPLKPADENDAEHVYKEWLCSVYEQSWSKLLQCIEQGKPHQQVQALSTAMKILVFEGKYPIEQTDPNVYYFPSHRLRAILMKILSCEANMSHLLKTFQEYSSYVDIVYYTWKQLPPLTPKTQPNEIYTKNFLELIDKIPMPADNINNQSNDDGSSALLCCHLNAKPAFIFDYNSIKKWMNKVWNCAMQWEYTPATHKQLLIVLLERILPHLEKPMLLTDFLMDSLDIGGAVSLLALRGIYTMITVHNLDCPNIYGKLYAMFEPEIFHTKFKPRLFYLSDLFLSSKHLPEHLVAAFAKRLARLSLVAPSEDILIICLFIGNLILRHPGLKRMINHPSGGEVLSDPYIMEERDPYKSKALESSLWEIQTLQSHASPSVASAASFINQPLPSAEWDMSRVLQNTSDSIFEKEMRKITTEIILSFNKSQSASLPRGEKSMQYWQTTS